MNRSIDLIEVWNFKKYYYDARPFLASNILTVTFILCLYKNDELQYRGIYLKMQMTFVDKLNQSDIIQNEFYIHNFTYSLSNTYLPGISKANF